MAGKNLSKAKIASLCKTCKELIVRDAETQKALRQYPQVFAQFNWESYFERMVYELRKKKEELGQIFESMSNSEPKLNASLEKAEELETNERKYECKSEQNLSKAKIASLCKTCKALIIRDAETQKAFRQYPQVFAQLNWESYLKKMVYELRKKKRELSQIFEYMSNSEPKLNASLEKPEELETYERKHERKSKQENLPYLVESNKNLEEIKRCGATLPYHEDLLDNFPQESAFPPVRSLWPFKLDETEPVPLKELDLDNDKNNKIGTAECEILNMKALPPGKTVISSDFTSEMTVVAEENLENSNENPALASEKHLVVSEKPLNVLETPANDNVLPTISKEIPEKENLIASEKQLNVVKEGTDVLMLATSSRESPEIDEKNVHDKFVLASKKPLEASEKQSVFSKNIPLITKTNLKNTKIKYSLALKSYLIACEDQSTDIVKVINAKALQAFSVVRPKLARKKQKNAIEKFAYFLKNHLIESENQLSMMKAYANACVLSTFSEDIPKLEVVKLRNDDGKNLLTSGKPISVLGNQSNMVEKAADAYILPTFSKQVPKTKKIKPKNDGEKSAIVPKKSLDISENQSNVVEKDADASVMPVFSKQIPNTEGIKLKKDSERPALASKKPLDVSENQKAANAYVLPAFPKDTPKITVVKLKNDDEKNSLPSKKPLVEPENKSNVVKNAIPKIAVVKLKNDDEKNSLPSKKPSVVPENQSNVVDKAADANIMPAFSKETPKTKEIQSALASEKRSDASENQLNVRQKAAQANDLPAFPKDMPKLAAVKLKNESGVSEKQSNMAKNTTMAYVLPEFPKDSPKIAVLKINNDSEKSQLSSEKPSVVTGNQLNAEEKDADYKKSALDFETDSGSSGNQLSAAEKAAYAYVLLTYPKQSSKFAEQKYADQYDDANVKFSDDESEDFEVAEKKASETVTRSPKTQEPPVLPSNLHVSRSSLNAEDSTKKPLDPIAPAEDHLTATMKTKAATNVLVEPSQTSEDLIGSSAKAAEQPKEEQISLFKTQAPIDSPPNLQVSSSSHNAIDSTKKTLDPIAPAEEDHLIAAMKTKAATKVLVEPSQTSEDLIGSSAKAAEQPKEEQISLFKTQAPIDSPPNLQVSSLSHNAIDSTKKPLDLIAPAEEDDLIAKTQTKASTKVPIKPSKYSLDPIGSKARQMPFVSAVEAIKKLKEKLLDFSSIAKTPEEAIAKQEKAENSKHRNIMLNPSMLKREDRILKKIVNKPEILSLAGAVTKRRALLKLKEELRRRNRENSEKNK